MRQSTKYILLASVAIVTVGAVMLLGLDHSWANGGLTGGKTIAEQATTGGVITSSIGGSGQIMRQGLNVGAAAMVGGGAFKLYSNAKNNFKEGAKDFVVPVIMGLTGGMILAAPFIANSGAKTLGADGSETIAQQTGGKVGW